MGRTPEPPGESDTNFESRLSLRLHRVHTRCRPSRRNRSGSGCQSVSRHGNGGGVVVFSAAGSTTRRPMSAATVSAVERVAVTRHAPLPTAPLLAVPVAGTGTSKALASSRSSWRWSCWCWFWCRFSYLLMDAISQTGDAVQKTAALSIAEEWIETLNNQGPQAISDVGKASLPIAPRQPTTDCRRSPPRAT